MKLKKEQTLRSLRSLRLCGEDSFGAFTLVELMIVMGIIVIFMGMLFTVVISMKRNVRKKQALGEAHSIALALKHYRMEFGKWPNQIRANADSTYFTNNNLVIRHLRGDNPRGKVFLSIQATNQTDSLNNFIDPWGVPYVICLDEDMNGSCLIHFGGIIYNNDLAVPPTAYSYSATNYSVANVEVAVASFAGGTNANLVAFTVESWSQPQ